MNLPEYVLVYGQEIPVVVVENLTNEKGEELLGDTNGEIIRIDSKCPKKDLKGTLLHELWHCFIRKSGLIQNPDHNEALEEIEAEGFQTIINDNFIIYPRKR